MTVVKKHPGLMTRMELISEIDTFPWKMSKDAPPVTLVTDYQLAILGYYCLANCGRQERYQRTGEPVTYDGAMILKYGPELLRRLVSRLVEEKSSVETEGTKQHDTQSSRSKPVSPQV